jgi:hypothetical protein
VIVAPSIVNVPEPALTKKLVLSTILIVPEKLLSKLRSCWSVPTKNTLLVGMVMGPVMGPGPPFGGGMNVCAHAGSGNTIISQTAYRIPSWLSVQRLSH